MQIRTGGLVPSLSESGSEVGISLENCFFPPLSAAELTEKMADTINQSVHDPSSPLLISSETNSLRFKALCICAFVLFVQEHKCKSTNMELK